MPRPVPVNCGPPDRQERPAVRKESGEQHGLGIGLTAASAVAYSTAGFFTRLIHLDPWTILFWRGLFAGLFIACCILWRYRRATWAVVRAIGLPGLAAASLSTLATIFFINAFRRTSVADVTIIFATAPFVTAALGWLWIGERESWTTLVASTGALLGVIVMVSGAVMEGHLFGDLLAFGMTMCMALMMIIIRRHRDTPMLPAACLSAFLCPVVVAPIARPAAAGATDLLFLALFGITQFGLGLLLLTLGARLISATESALMNALEGPLAPFWVWLAFREVPSPATLIGGVIVMLAVSAHILTSGRTRTVPRRSAAMRGS
jgi:drug/metabolite transporter (DMT)-like permease